MGTTPMTCSMTSRGALLLLLCCTAAAHYGALLAAAASSSSGSASSPLGSPTTSTDPTACDPELLFQKLYVLLPAIDQCAEESEFQVTPGNLSFPTSKNIERFCASKNCTQLAVQLENAGLPSCTVAVGNESMSFKEYVTEVRGQCASPVSDGGDGSDNGALSGMLSRVVGSVVVVACLLHLLL